MNILITFLPEILYFLDSVRVQILYQWFFPKVESSGRGCHFTAIETKRMGSSKRLAIVGFCSPIHPGQSASGYPSSFQLVFKWPEFAYNATII